MLRDTRELDDVTRALALRHDERSKRQVVSVVGDGGSPFLCIGFPAQREKPPRDSTFT